MSWGGLRRTCAAAVVVAVAGLAQAGPASAHSYYVRSLPADGGNVAVSPDRISIDVTQPVEARATRVTVTNAAGQTVSVGAVSVVAPVFKGSFAPTTIVAALPARLAQGVYRVSWSTLSSDDLHVTSGAFVFGVNTATKASGQQGADPLPPWDEVLARWALLLGFATSVGAGLLTLLLRRRGTTATDPDLAVGDVTRRLLGLGAVAAGVAGLAGLAQFVVQSQVFGRGGLTEAGRLLTGGYALRWVPRELAAAALVAAFLRLRRRLGAGAGAEALRRPLLVVVATAVPVLGVTSALLGHAGVEASRHPGTVLLAGTHVASVLLWAGTLLATLVVLVPGTGSAAGDLRRRALSRFGLVAVWCVTAMVASGLALAATDVVSLDALLLSTYGRVLVAKSIAVALVLAVGATSALVLHPALAPAALRRRLPSAARLRVVVAVEAVLAAVVLVLAAGLASSAPANGPAWAAGPTSVPLVDGTAADLVETLTVSPNTPGQTFITVTVANTRRPAPAPFRTVQVTLHAPNGITVVRQATPADQGTPSGPGTFGPPSAWVVSGGDITVPGTWRFDVAVLRDGMPVAAASYPWVVDDPAVTARPTHFSKAPLAPWLDDAAIGLVVLAAVLGLGGALWSRRRGAAPVEAPKRPVPAPAVEPAAPTEPVTSAEPEPVGSRE